jgi:hypothetical protein
MSKGAWIAGIAGVLILGGAIGGNSDSSGGGDSSPGAKSSCEGWVTDRLRSPGTADFSGEDVVGSDSGPWSITGLVDSENGFGALLRSSWVCDVHLSGNYYKGHVSVLPS